MAGKTLIGGIKAAASNRVRFALATNDDDAEIRRLLRENPIHGKISLSLEREPDYFADIGIPGEEKQTIIARENGRIICIGNCTVRERFVNGQLRRVGYLGGLRLDARAAGRSDVVRRGYEFFRELQSATTPDFFFTSIVADNERARQFLERGLSGMPTYQFAGEFVTLLLPSRRSSLSAGARSAPGSGTLLQAVNDHHRFYQFAPVVGLDEWPAQETLGLSMNDFVTLHHNGQMTACAALWDQRGFKQTVLRGYSRGVTWSRPLINCAARLARRPRLPAVGTTLSHAVVSHLTVKLEEPATVIELIEVLRSQAAERQIDFITLGFAANDPRLATIRGRFKCREYRSRLYVVRWQETPGSAADLDGRILQPELALL